MRRCAARSPRALTLVDAVGALTLVPARAIGREHDLGTLAPASLADAVLLSADLHVRGVWIGGAAV